MRVIYYLVAAGVCLAMSGIIVLGVWMLSDTGIHSLGEVAILLCILGVMLAFAAAVVSVIVNARKS